MSLNIKQKKIMANFENDFEKKLDISGFNCWMTDAYMNDDVSESACTEIVIYENGTVNFKTFRLPKKKEVSVSWIVDKWEKAENRISMGPILKKAIDKAGILPKFSIDVYSTTYGIGVFVLFGEPAKSYKKIKEWLDTNGIKWEKGLSPAGWVFRFKISKASENLNLINSL